MACRVTEIIIDCHDLQTMTAFWSAALGYHEGGAGDAWQSIAPPLDQPSEQDLRAAPQVPLIAFVEVPEAKTVKNRVHLDVTPIDRSRDAEVERLLALGARLTGQEQPVTPWVVLADPEGNEFCVMPQLA